MIRKLVFAALLAAAAIAPATAQNVQRIKPMVAPNAAQSVVVDYQAQFNQEREKNKQLRAENEQLRAQLAECTKAGGSRVAAYCENPTTSRNTAGAVNDCAVGGYTCEPVSGLCRTRASNSMECAAGFTYCAKYQNCVRSAGECQ